MTQAHKGPLDLLAGLARRVRKDRLGEMARRVRRARPVRVVRPVRKDPSGRAVQPVSWAPQVRKELQARLGREEPTARRVRRAYRDREG